MGSHATAVTYTSDIASVSRKEFLDNQANTKSRPTLKSVWDLIRAHNQCHLSFMTPSFVFSIAIVSRKFV